jgi:hypothetical protein
VTDEEVTKEFDRFHGEIHQVSLKSRHFAWYSMMILLIVGLGLIYVSSFAHLHETSSSSTSPFSEDTRKRLLFLFFWGGVYSDYDYGTYARSTYPFYILMLLLIMERLAQMWIENRFGCDEALIHKFKLIEKNDLWYNNLAKEKKKLTERRSVRQRRTTSRLPGSRMSMVSSATESDH